MSLLDFSLLIALGGFVLAGFWFGIVHMVGAFAGLILGVVLAGQFQDNLAPHIVGWVGGNQNLAHILAFVLLYTIVARLAGVVLWAIEHIFGFFTVIPFLKTFDRLLGAALGFVEGAITIGLAIYFSARFPITTGFTTALQHSEFAGRFKAVGETLAPLLPIAIRAIRSVI